LTTPNWSRPLPRPIIIPNVMELTTLADIRILVEKHLPKEYRAKFTWRQLAGALERDEFRFVHILSLPSSVSTVRV